jgi:hypothetical protein
MAKEAKEVSERKAKRIPTSFHIDKDHKITIDRYLLSQKEKGVKTSQENFINEAIAEKLKKLKLI